MAFPGLNHCWGRPHRVRVLRGAMGNQASCLLSMGVKARDELMEIHIHTNYRELVYLNLFSHVLSIYPCVGNWG